MAGIYYDMTTYWEYRVDGVDYSSINTALADVIANGAALLFGEVMGDLGGKLFAVGREQGDNSARHTQVFMQGVEHLGKGLFLPPALGKDAADLIKGFQLAHMARFRGGTFIIAGGPLSHNGYIQSILKL